MNKWHTHSETKLGDYRILDMYSVDRSNPSGTIRGEFYYLKAHNWVNIMPITKDNKVVLVKQYRHGSDSITLELPAGLVEQGEEPLKAAIRECIEETGYESESQPELLGTVLPNPAFIKNKCYIYLWKDCELKHKQNLDKDEEIEIVVLDFEEVKEKIRTGEINHSIALNCFFFYSQKYKF